MLNKDARHTLNARLIELRNIEHALDICRQENVSIKGVEVSRIQEHLRNILNDLQKTINKI